MQCRSITISSKMKSFISMNMYNLEKWARGNYSIYIKSPKTFIFKGFAVFRTLIIFFQLLPIKLITYHAHLQIMIRTKDTIKLSHISRVCSLVAIHSLYEASSSTAAAALIESLHETNGTRDVNLATPSFMGETRQNGPSY